MTTEEACRRLGVSHDASREQIEHAFRRIAKEVHPDLTEGDRELWDRLVEARDVLLGEAAGKDLVPVSVAIELARTSEKTLDRLEGRRERTTATQGEVRSVVHRHTSRLDRRKRDAWALSLASGGIAASVAIMRAVVLTGPSADENAIIAGLIAAFTLLAGFAGLAGFASRARAEHLGHEIEDITNQLSQRSQYLRVLTEIKRVSDTAPPFEAEALDEAIDVWSSVVGPDEPASLALTAMRIGARDFARIFVAKGLELRILEESTIEVDGELWVTYYVVDHGNVTPVG
jgi:hypothetical protein